MPNTDPKGAVDMTTKATSLSRFDARARIAFFFSIAIVALHIADDSFLQPQPGTSAADHLLSGLVPLAALGLAAFGYPRVRAGARGTIALLAGIAGLVASSEAIYYSAKVGPSGDDFTGLLCIPAGLVLVAIGAATLWRSRKREDHLGFRIARRSGLTVASVAAALLLAVPFAYSYVLTHVARTPVDHVDLGAGQREVELHTSDGLTLDGTYVPSRNGAAVVVAFGRKGTQRPARMLARHGFGVLIFDRRGEGESDGDPNPYAWDEGERDLHAAVEFLQRRSEVEPGRIGGLGLSVGGETFLQAAAHNEDIEAVISEGAASRSVGEVLSIPGSPLPMVVANVPITAGTALFSDATPPEHLIDLVDEIAPRPMFLIYATEGTGGEEHRANRAYFREAGPPKQIWEIPEAGHVGGQEARPLQYERRVTRFFDDALLEERG